MKKCLIIVQFIFSLCALHAQNCIDYGEIDGPNCVCVPSGWTGFTGAEEIDNISDYMGGGCETNVDAESPSGGSFSAFHIIPNGGIEGMSTVISGLTPGTEYSLGFWWMSVEYECPGLGVIICCADLSITVDGVEYDFDAADDWELAELCVTASSSNMSIEVTGIDNGGMQGHIIVDNIECTDLTPCCLLMVEMVEELEICPLTDLQIEGEYYDETGNVEISWDCDPPEGLDYLSDTGILEPIFNYPYLLEDQDLIFDFTVTVSDDNCTVSREVLVTVLKNTESTFDFETDYCNNDVNLHLPLISLEGNEGTWNIPEINFSEYENAILDLEFTPIPNNQTCPLPFEIDIDIDEYKVPEFDFNTTLCRSEQKYIFPDESLNNVDGEWTPYEICFEDYPDDEYTITFVPDELKCSEPVELTIEISTGEMIEFDLPSQFCSDAEILTLPVESENGIKGFWDRSQLNPSLYDGQASLIFTSTEEGCFQQYVYNFEVLESFDINFEFPDTLCRSSMVFKPDSQSIEGYIGYWTPNEVFLDTITQDSLTFKWINLDENIACLDSVVKTLHISNKSTITINLPDSFCVGSSILILDNLNFDQAVSGQWSAAEIDFNVLDPGPYSYVFQPDSQYCYEAFNFEFIVEDSYLPEFSLPEFLCETDLPIALPVIDNNGVQGSWSQSTFDIADFNEDSLLLSFTVEDQTINCFDLYEHVFYLENPEIPIFEIDSFICWNSSDFELPELSLNGISGSWNVPTLSSSLSMNDTIKLIFTPVPESCSENIGLEVILIDAFDIMPFSYNPTGCNSNDGLISIEGVTTDLEFSLDDGLNWQSETTFENLDAGIYDLLVRSSTQELCSMAFEIELLVPDIPVISSILISDISDCMNANGEVMLESNLENVEYSIDGSSTWSTSGVFSNLDAGMYTVTVRSADQLDCSSTFNFEILAPIPTMISNVDTENLSDCMSNDGIIHIEAFGESLIFSIDNGENWQTENTFTDLTSGTYNIIVSSSTQQNCIDTTQVVIGEPALLDVDSLVLTDPSSCMNTSGLIRIIADGENLIYSINNGIDWSTDNTFEDLSAGTYNVVVSNPIIPMCNFYTVVELILLDDQLDLPEYQLYNPTDCQSNDGGILFNEPNNLQVSIDLGISWDDPGVLSNLESGTYFILIREKDNPDCTTELEFEIIEVECECPELQIDFIVNDFYCDGGEGEIIIDAVSGFNESILSLSWNNGQSGNQTYISGNGLYILSVEYDQTCLFTDSIYVELQDPIFFGLEIFDSDCEESDNGSVEINSVEGGSAPYNYSLNPEAYQESNLFTDLSSGEYTAYVKDENGCVEYLTFNIENKEALLENLPDVEPIEQGESTYLNPLINLNSIDSFSWAPSEYVLNTGELIAEVQPDQTTEFQLTIYYGDCIEIRSIVVEVLQSEVFYFSNLISTSSLNNNTFFLQGKNSTGLSIQELIIYDRWGNQIFEKLNPEINKSQDGWDGYYNNQKVNPGVFIYSVKYQLNGQEHIKYGSLTVVN